MIVFVPDAVDKSGLTSFLVPLGDLSNAVILLCACVKIESDFEESLSVPRPTSDYQKYLLPEDEE